MFCSKKESDEAAKLKRQDEVKRFYLFSFHVYHLRDLLKCSICLELYSCPIELSNCKHVFCKDCIESCLEYADDKEARCPICLQHIGNGNKNEHHNFFEEITTFVKHALEDVNIILGSNLNRLPSYPRIFELWEQNKESPSIFRNIKTSTLLSPLAPDYSAILKAKNVVVDANTRYATTDKEENNTFDALVQSPAHNPFFKPNMIRPVTKTYTTNKKQCYVDKFKKFEDDANKRDILNWLQDSRNRFDVFPSTQQLISQEIPDFDLPSVSQKLFEQKHSRSSHIKKANAAPKIQRDAFVKDRCKIGEKRRARSLECYVKLTNSRPSLKRHSFSTCHTGDEFVIEQVNSQEDAAATNTKKAALNLLEDKCLDEIEKDLFSKDKETSSDSTKVDKRSSLRSSKLESSMDSSGGWNRMKELKKTIGSTKGPKKLKVISRNSSANKINEHQNNTTNPRKKRKREDLLSVIEENTEGSDKQPIDLKEVEHSNNNSKKAIVEASNNRTQCSKTNRNKSEKKVDNRILETKSNSSVPSQKDDKTTDSHLYNEVKGVNQIIPSLSEKCSNQTNPNPSQIKDGNEIIPSLSEVTHKTQRSSSIKDKCKTSTTRRARSLEYYVKLVTPRPTLKRHSFSTFQPEEEIVIEQVSSEEDAVPRTSSNKFLGTTEQDNKQIPTEEDRRSSLRSSKQESSMNTSRGWNRIKQLAKTIGKTRKSRILKIVSSNSSINVIDDSTNSRRKRKRDNLPSKIEESTEDNNKKCYDLNEVELYFNKYLDKVTAEEVNIQPIEKEERIDVLKKKDEISKVLAESNKIDLDLIIQKGKQIDKDGVTVDQVHSEVIDEEISNTENIIPSSEKNEMYQNMLMVHGTENTENLPEPQLCRNSESLSQIDLESTKANKGTSSINLIDDDEIFTLLTQKIVNDENINRNETSDYFTNQFLFIQNIVNTEKDPEEVLNRLRHFFLYDEKKSVDKILKPVSVQTDDIKKPAVILSHVFTQTSTCCHRDAGTQTEGEEQLSGFRISSTDMFNIHPVISSSIQTDCLLCPNCNYVISGNDKSTSQNSVPKRTPKIFSLSPSFDNLNFDTQEVLKGQEILLQGLLTKSSPSVNSEPKRDQAILRGPSDNGSAQIISQTFKEVTTSKRVRTESPQNNSESHLSQTVKKNQHLNDVSIEFLTETDGNTDRAVQAILRDPSDNGSAQIISQTFKEVTTSKRVRTESPQNNSESHLSQTVKKNRHLNDVSIEFLTETDGNTDRAVQGQTQKLPSLNSDDIDYAEVDNVIRQCQEEKSSRPISKNFTPYNIRIEPVPKRLKTQDIIRECEQIINEACSTTLRIDQTQCVPDLQKSLTLLEEFNKNFKGDELQIEPQTKVVEDNTTKKGSENLFTSIQNLKDSEQPLNQNVSRQDVDQLISRFQELEDSFEKNYNAEVESITESMLKSDNRPQIATNLTLEKKRKHDVQINEDANNSADMFDSDQEVIETTPQKNRPIALEEISLLSQAYYNPIGKMKLPLDDPVDPLSCFNKTFTPPPEFQDFVDTDIVNIESEDKENIRLSSLTTDILQNELLNCKDEFLITSTPLSIRSQVLSKSLNLSPIHSNDNQMNPILAVQSGSRLPLTITRSKTPPRQKPLNASTPKQKSILNYVKPGVSLNTTSDTFSDLSQSSFVRATPVHKKPTVACTRMKKNELLMITSLANKKIITFTTSFTSMVTHMIVAVDRRNHLSDQTMKFVSAVAAGAWVVSIKWIEECLKQNKVIPEEPYEALDVSGVDGPRQSRLNRSRNPLLHNYLIYAAPPFRSTTQREVENVIILLGGKIVHLPDDLLRNSDGKICLIITDSSGSQPDDIYETWLETLKVVTVDLEWLSRSVGKFEVQSLRPFALCNEESICSLAYPSALLEDVSYPFSHTLT